MKQVFETYDKWEDYNAGMYSLLEPNDKQMKIQLSIKLLSNKYEFCNVMKMVSDKWVVSTAVNLTNKSINRRAWLGAAACCFAHGATEIITRIAWAMLTEKQQSDANAIADRFIIEYERKNNRIHKKMGECMLF